MKEIITVSLSLKIEVESQEDRDYYLNPKTGEVAAACVADIFDNADTMVGTLLTVDGLTKQDVQSLLNAELGI